MTKNALFFHCLATPNDFMEGRPVEEVVSTVKRWHLDRGWSDIGYAGIIHRDGTYAGGRDKDNDGDFFEETGAHAKGFNVSGIGVALVGGKDSKRTDKFSDNYTEAQRATLWKLIDQARARYGKDIEIRGHNEVSSKACPGFNVQEFLREGRPTGKKFLQVGGKPVVKKSLTGKAPVAAGAAGAGIAGVTALGGNPAAQAAILVACVAIAALIIWRTQK